MKMKDFGFYRGVNLGGWFSQCDYSESRMDHFITEKDFGIIAEWGLDHVRIPVDYNVLEKDGGTWKPDGFRRIENALKCAEKNGLKVVLDLHKTAGFSFDTCEKEEGFFPKEGFSGKNIGGWQWMVTDTLSNGFGELTIDSSVIHDIDDREAIKENLRTRGGVSIGVNDTENKYKG